MITNADISASYEPLRALSIIHMPAVAAYRVALAFDEVQRQFRIYAGVAQKIAEDYGERDDNGRLVKSDNGGTPINAEDGKKALADLNAEEVTLNIKTISLAELGNLELTPALLAPLRWLITE